LTDSDKLSSPPTLRIGGRHALVNKLKRALLDYDTAYEDCIIEWPKSVTDNKPISMTEERLKIATRNKMRERGQDFPELVRWDLRMAVGFRSEEE
jgi:hypothetical protein